MCRPCHCGIDFNQYPHWSVIILLIKGEGNVCNIVFAAFPGPNFPLQTKFFFGRVFCGNLNGTLRIGRETIYVSYVQHLL